MTTLELWGGLECTLNRVQDRFINQAEKSGHTQRLNDLNLFAGLGIKKIRYPCLWETVVTNNRGQYEWSYLDERLARIKELGMIPIAGFLHHGSGPAFTNLLDPEFPEKLAEYAQAFARRYPWVQHYTPINEIITTARFSCLYGHWYPHKNDSASFLMAVKNQVKGTILSMQAIREVVPEAKLIQTDDIGRAQGTPPLKDQVEFENERRWLGWDFLTGKVTPYHPLYGFLTSHGISLEDIQWFYENSCPPDVIGLNHYPLSNRFLDHRKEFYPASTHGGNGVIDYADVGAVDTGQTEVPSAESIFLEAWDRYRIPLAITEVHCRGYRDEQMRWLYHIWKSAKKVQDQGIQIHAVTAWSLLGTYDWHKLCTVCEMFYEPGVFDLRSSNGLPRPTALSQLIKDLASQGVTTRPIFETLDLWAASRNIQWAPTSGNHSTLYNHSDHSPILIIGGSSRLNQAFAQACGERNIPFRIIDNSQLEKQLVDLRPWALIHPSSEDQEASQLASLSVAHGLTFLTFSKDQKILNLNPDAILITSHEEEENFIPSVHTCLDLIFDGEKGMIQLSQGFNVHKQTQELVT